MSLVRELIEEFETDLNMNKGQLQSLTNQLALQDASIDKIDNMIYKIDSEIPPLLDEVNLKIDAVKAAYDARVAAGCRSNLSWLLLGETTYSYFSRHSGSGSVTIRSWQAVRNTKTTYPYYGLKYYRKPLNRDYGSNIILETQGIISSGSTVLAVVGTSGTTGAKIDDIVTDNIDNPTTFSTNNLPKIVGFGTTSIVGIVTSISGKISSGSTIYAQTGIGSTSFVSIGQYLINDVALPADTKIVGFGTTSVTVEYFDESFSRFETSTAIVDAIYLDKVSIAASTGTFNVGVVSTYPSFLLSTSAGSNNENGLFTVIRQDELDDDFDYTKSPLSPITIGIVNSPSYYGVGHSCLIVNNGSPSGPVQWKNNGTDPEPSIGADKAEYYAGTTQWPVIYNCPEGGGCANVYVPEGYTFISTTTNAPTYASTAENGINPNGTVCNNLTTAIATAEAELQQVINSNLEKAKILASESYVLRKIRDKKELIAWSTLQSISYTKSKISELEKDYGVLTSKDFSSYET